MPFGTRFIAGTLALIKKPMLVITDKPKLESSNGKEWLSMDTRYLVQVSFTFDLSVRLNSYNGQSHFCARKDQLKELVYNLSKLKNKPLVNTKIEDNDSDAYLKFKSIGENLVLVEGQVGGTHEDAFLKFAFESNYENIQSYVDQLTKLLLFVDDQEAETNYEKLKN
jgi:hypothetical protein